MAIWQYQFKVLPRDLILNNLIPHKYDVDGYFEDDFFWEKTPTKLDFFKEIIKIYPRGKSWSENLIIYGNLESNCFEIYCKDNLVKSVSFRIDFTSNFEHSLRMILEFLNFNNLIVINDTNLIIKNNYDSILALIYNSPQYTMYKKLK